MTENEKKKREREFIRTTQEHKKKNVSNNNHMFVVDAQLGDVELLIILIYPAYT